jgi:PilZ domain
MEPEKRRFKRKRTDQLVYAEFGPENGSILLNLSEGGCSFQSMAPVREERLRFSVSVGDGRKLEGDGQMVWSDTSKKTGGLRFLNPSEELQEQISEWLEETLVTADGRLDQRAVSSQAKRRRKKLREEANAAAELAWKEGAGKAGKETWTTTTVGQPRAIQTPEATRQNSIAHSLSFNAADESSRLGYGNSTGPWRSVGAILLVSVLLVTLVGYRRELGHLVMSFGSSIAGEEQKSGGAAPVEPRAEASPVLEAKPVAMSDQTEVKESAAEAVPVSNEEVARSPEVQEAVVKRSTVQHRVQQMSATVPPVSSPDDVSSLWTSVESGDTHAEVMLASRYVRGEGVPQSCAQARVLLEAAVKRDSAEAKQKLDELPQAGCP